MAVHFAAGLHSIDTPCRHSICGHRSDWRFRILALGMAVSGGRVAGSDLVRQALCSSETLCP